MNASFNPANEFRNLSEDEIAELTKHVIGLRIAARSSGRIQGGKVELRQELQNLYSLPIEQIKEKYRYHQEQYRAEQNS